MLVLVTYDVSTMDRLGVKRLARISKTCQNYGQRVQNSVFECLIDPAQLVTLKKRIESIMDPKQDSIRYYYLGNNWERKVEHVGAKASYNPEGSLII